jgi:hypothetical protein
VTRGGVDGEGDGFNDAGVGTRETSLTIGSLYSSSYLFNVLALALVRSMFGVGQCLMTVATNEKAGSVVGGGERGVGRGAKSIFTTQTMRGRSGVVDAYGAGKVRDVYNCISRTALRR